MPPTDDLHSAGRPLDRLGAVAGAVLRASRLSAGVSQAVMAARADVTEETIQSWEDGSSPLASVPFAQVETLAAALTATGADPAIVADLHAAAWCDLVILAFRRP
jgi:DNA-binding XRE family transcriptional regulator